MAMNVTAQLAKVPLFSTCSKRELDMIARAAKEVHHREGAVIAKEGEPGIGLFMITDGNAIVSVGGTKKGKLGPGDFFGEIALLDGGPRTATVTAASDVTMLGLTEWMFRGLIAEHPAIALKTLEAVAGRLRSLTKAATA